MNEPRPPVFPAVPGYRLLRQLHRGGQGVVYEAEQLDPPRTVAVKVLAEGLLADEAARRRFEREVELAATLDHPGLVQVLGSGDCSEGRYLVMPLVGGRDLADWLREEQPSLRRRLEVFLKICEAVSHAHRRGIIHRDLKPANVRIEEGDRPVVLDFGLAKPLEATATLTHTGVFAGTVSYASPEQLSGDSNRLDTRSDVYSLCALLHEVLCGVPPFPEATDLASAISAALHVEPRGPTARRAEVPRDLDAIVLKGLAKDREHRYATVDALAEDVRRHLDGEPVRARADNRWYVLRRSLARHRGALAAALAIVGLVVTGFVLVVQERDKALAAQAEAERNAQVSDGIADYVLTALASTHEDGRERTVREMLAVAAGEALEKLEGEPRVRADVLRRLATTQSELGNHDAAIELVQRALRELERLPGDDLAERRLQCQRTLFRAAFRDDRLELAAEANARSLELQREIDPSARAKILALMLNRAVVSAALSRPEAPGQLLEVVEAADEVSDPRGNYALMAKLNLGLFASLHGDLAEAERYYREVLAARRARGDGPKAIGLVLAHVAEAVEMQGRHEEAIELQRESVRVLEEYFAQPELALAQQRVVLAAYLAPTAIDEALAILDQAETEIREAAGEENLWNGVVLNARAVALREAGRLEEAWGAHAAARAWHAEHAPGLNGRTGTALLETARTAALREGPEAALEWGRRALEHLRPNGDAFRNTFLEAQEAVEAWEEQAG